MASTSKSSTRVPAYRLHRPSGQAVVRLDGRDIYLGRHGTPESREKYDRTVAEWLLTRAAPTPARQNSVIAGPDLAVSELLIAFWKHAQVHYRGADGTPSEELGNIKATLKPVRRLYGGTPAKDFGPLALRAVQKQMVDDGLCRTTINGRINRIRHVFKWGVSLEKLPASVFDALRTVPGLQRGRTAARESEPVGPVAVDVVGKTLPFLSRPVAGMVRLQLLTAMRPGEVCMMRDRDIDRSDATWVYRPASHKTAWRGKTREIHLGPKAQEILKEFAQPDSNAYVFDPKIASPPPSNKEGKVRSRRSTTKDSGRPLKPEKPIARRYSRTSYLVAIRRACDRAFPHPTLSKFKPGELTADQKVELAAWRKACRWKPNQLRHTRATEVRAQHGLEAAQAVLGHSKADTTQIYAERDSAKAREVMARTG